MSPSEFLRTLMAAAALDVPALAQASRLRPTQIQKLLDQAEQATLGSFLKAVDACGYTVEFRLQAPPPPAPPMLDPASHPGTRAVK